MKKKYFIKANHPIFRYVNFYTDDKQKFWEKMNELLAAGYEFEDFTVGPLKEILDKKMGKINPEGCTCGISHTSYANTAEVVICTNCNGFLDTPK